MFHINLKTGESGKCSAKAGKCPFGSLDEHFTSEDAARKFYEKEMANKTINSIKKAPVSNLKVIPPSGNVEQYRKIIEDLVEPEVYEHPQGKVFIYDMATHTSRVYKGGRAASSSGNITQMRAGRGAWKAVDLSLFDSKANPQITANYARVQTLISKGLPGNSPLDPNKKPDWTQASEFSTYGQFRDSGAAILPLRQRLNPHKPGIEKHDLQNYWGVHDKSMNLVKGPVFEVWKDNLSGNYKFVTTSGSTIEKFGGQRYFAHDQTGAHMGNKHTLVGAFRAEPDGAMEGEVPSVSAPIYTYK